ncbi:MAG: peptidylprolyl isomerase [Chitinophagales bacterium]|nr:peptidylprolyl isomerase [Chitinophagales bacterium]
MKRFSVFLILLVFLTGYCSAQTLFTYGNDKVDAKEFLRAYKKNNTQPVANKEKSIREYLDLFIKSKLKVKEAYSRGYDTLPNLKTEFANLRAQIIEGYMTNPDILDKMTHEAFVRSLKDIELSHIFISFKNAAGALDTTVANKKKDEVLALLKKGTAFDKVAMQYSDDPSAKENKGYIGFITVFSLPYELEKAAYNTRPGHTTDVIRSNSGYHILKVMSERKALGKMKVQQILLAFPPGTDEANKKLIGKKADSLYKLIQSGRDFGQLASTFSNDYISAATGGNIPDISVGQYDPVFEKQVWSLKKDGSVSKPFQTEYGWHILKRVTAKPLITDENDKENLKVLEQKVKTDGRWKESTDFIYNEVKNKAGARKEVYSAFSLWALADSILNNQFLRPDGRNIQLSTPLFSIGDQKYTAGNFIDYARTYRFKPDGSGAKPYDQLTDEWEKYIMKNYYQDHLEEFNEDFRNQMAEFKDGNLFFEIMQQEIWNKAQADTTALLALYNQNKPKYIWNKSADAVIFFCSDGSVSQKVYDAIRKSPLWWKNTVAQYSELVYADSSRLEWDQIPGIDNSTPVSGMVTKPQINSTDNTASFAWISKVYSQPMQRSFNEARGLVMNDYQEILDKKWDVELRKKYPVVINEATLNSILK